MKNGGGDQSRTDISGVMSPVLSQLSYPAMRHIIVTWFSGYLWRFENEF